MVTVALTLLVLAAGLASRSMPIRHRPPARTSWSSSATTSAGATPGPTATPPSARRTSTAWRAPGLLVRYAFGTSPQCSPSRISILSGRFPHATRTEDLHTPLPDGVRLLPAYLQDAGLLHRPHGEDALRAQRASGSSSGTRRRPPRRCRRFLDSAGTRPFFLWVGFHEPHRPYDSTRRARRARSRARDGHRRTSPTRRRRARTWPATTTPSRAWTARSARCWTSCERRKLRRQHAGRVPERQRRAVSPGEGDAVRLRDADAAHSRPGPA